jgi:Na+/H+ antiporter NhaC
MAVFVSAFTVALLTMLLTGSTGNPSQSPPVAGAFEPGAAVTGGFQAAVAAADSPLETPDTPTPGDALNGDNASDTAPASSQSAGPASDAVNTPSAAGSANTSVPDPAAGASNATSAPVAAAPLPAPASYYGLWTMAPALAAITLAITLRQVIPALLVGIFIAAFMMQPFRAPDANYSVGLSGPLDYVVASFRLAIEGYLIGAFRGGEGSEGEKHLMVILFTLSIGGLIGVIEAGGGTRAVVNIMARWASNSRRGQLTAWFAGLVVFFDDYANCLIVGPTMRPVFDRLQISRQKLSYIIDSTASCVASIMISTWLATEISMIENGLNAARHAGNLPEFLAGDSAFTVFWKSIPYRYYALLTILLVFLVAITRRDFGPMLKAERAAAATPPRAETVVADADAPRGRAWHAVVPVAVIVFGMVALLIATGWHGAAAEVAAEAQAGGSAAPVKEWIAILNSADTYRSVLYAGAAALFTAVAINLITRNTTLKRTFDGMLSGMSHVFPAMLVLSLAWALSHAASKELELGTVATQYINASLPPKWLPLCTFLAAALVSFATGTSWGTINILCPLAVSLGAGVTGAMSNATGEAEQIFLATVGAVLAGACFGDHCSPLNDSTVMAALVSECTLESHVWTQFPYAVVTMITSVFVGDVLVRIYQQPPWVGLLGGAVVLWLVLMIFGRRADRGLPPPTAVPAA